MTVKCGENIGTCTIHLQFALGCCHYVLPGGKESFAFVKTFYHPQLLRYHVDIQGIFNGVFDKKFKKQF